MNNIEHRHQAAFVRWAQLSKPSYEGLEQLHSIPNGGKRSAATGAVLKREGVKAGALDMFLPVARGGYHGLYLEFKTQKGRLSPNQKNFIKGVEAQGYKVAVARSSQEAIDAITIYYKG